MASAPMPLRRPRLQAAVMARPAELQVATPATRQIPHVITITSGKGGVGKTNLTANIGWHLRQLRRRVLIIDADLGLANIDVLLGLSPEFNLGHVIRGEKSMAEVLMRGPGGMRILPADSGVTELTELNDSQRMRILSEMESLQEDFDYILIDTGAGIASNVMYFNLAAQTMVVVVTPEPTSLTDAYALIKVLSGRYRQRRFKILANDVRDEAEGSEVFTNLTRVTDRFLDVSLDYLGCVPHAPQLRKAVQMQRLLSEVEPNSAAASAIRKLARKIGALENDPLRCDMGILWRNLLTRGS
ncbi:MinD/ParA family protein [bacterium]|nr:MinD/ParA family protein [bacterium]